MSAIDSVVETELRALTPLRPNLFVWGDHGEPLALRGCRCEVCGRTFFPARPWCTNCFVEGRLVDWALPRTGVVHASTVVRVRSAVGHEPPHAYGYVSLGDDAIRIFAPFAGDRAESFIPGRRVRLGYGAVPAAGVPATLGYHAAPDDGASHA